MTTSKPNLHESEERKEVRFIYRARGGLRVRLAYTPIIQGFAIKDERN